MKVDIEKSYTLVSAKEQYPTEWESFENMMCMGFTGQCYFDELTDAEKLCKFKSYINEL